MMMCLGMFVFSLPTLAYQDFQRQTEWKHPSTPRVGTMDAHQFTGKGADTITLSGWFAPEFNGSPLSLNILRSMGDTGQPYMLAEGTGRIYGQWIITSLSETRTILDSNGSGRRIEFSISLKCVDDDIRNGLENARKTLNQYLPGSMQLPEIPSFDNLSDLIPSIPSLPDFSDLLS